MILKFKIINMNFLSQIINASKIALGLSFFGLPNLVTAQQNQDILFENVSVFDGKNQQLQTNSYVLVSGNKIKTVSKTPIEKNNDVLVINGSGKTLIPGLIDVHVHMIFGALSMGDMMDPNLKPENLIAKVIPESEKMLQRGFTSVRDVGGPSFQLKQMIDEAKIQGPRIWPSGAMISQTSGHGDLRLPEERSRRFFGPNSKAENFGASFIADGKDEVLTAVRENLRFGASQIKLMAGGGTSSAYDPVDVTQYTLEEMQAAVEAAEDWGTYVTVHAYTPRAVRKAINAGVKCIEHGQLLDQSTLKLIKRKDIWLSCQNLMDNTPEMSEQRKEKRKPVVEGQKMIWPLAKKMKIKLAWGTDFLFEPWMNEEQNAYLLKLKEWFTPYEILKMATHDNAQLLKMSGNRSPYSGEIGVIKSGAFADMILVDGNPIENIDLIGNPAAKFLIIMKDGQIVKNILENKN